LPHPCRVLCDRVGFDCLPSIPYEHCHSEWLQPRGICRLAHLCRIFPRQVGSNSGRAAIYACPEAVEGYGGLGLSGCIAFPSLNSVILSGGDRFACESIAGVEGPAVCLRIHRISRGILTTTLDVPIREVRFS